MTQTSPTAAQLIDRFLAHRAGRITEPTLHRDREVMERLRTFLDANGPVVLDETTGRPLPRAAVGVGLSDLVNLELIVMKWDEFVRDGVRPYDRAAHVTLRQFALWLRQTGELDACGYLEMAAVVRAPQPTAPPGRWPERR
ncbi:hypothetical protein SAMN04515671_2863 [Nakamurella panacisegetis]|uniref:Uncharacterized protein n=1 Tax=Nakamurella panacisegetis TaxID=1090615 RepID=A0A1H0PP11_9ACTN|nr:hypothetical protein [Nakamurella panacisegetis]SDP06881.1 hypothetical protein SAMN04515671_2863 [Nakamurella panacisegetis]